MQSSSLRRFFEKIEGSENVGTGYTWFSPHFCKRGPQIAYAKHPSQDEVTGVKEEAQNPESIERTNGKVDLHAKAEEEAT